MLELFRSLALRVKAMFAANAALDLEADFLNRSAERKAELLRRAQKYEEEGLNGIALHLRQQADRLQLEKPLASLLPAAAAPARGCREALGEPVLERRPQ